MIKELENKWEKYLIKHSHDLIVCDRCDDFIFGYEHTDHYWKKHFIWMFCRRTGIHWKIYQLKSILGIKQ